MTEQESPLDWVAWYSWNGRKTEIYCRTRSESVAVAKAAGGHWRHQWCKGRPVYRTRADALAALRECPARYASVQRCYLDETVIMRRGRSIKRHHWHLEIIESVKAKVERTFDKINPKDQGREAA